MIFGRFRASRNAPGASVSYEYVAQYLYREVFAKHHVVKLGFDRWNFRHLKPWLLAGGLFRERDQGEVRRVRPRYAMHEPGAAGA